MIENKLTIESHVDFKVPIVPRTGNYTGEFVSLSPVILTIEETIEETTGFFRNTKRISKRISQKVGSRGQSCKWLEYFPGAITNINLGGMDVLTGPMSGCWVVIYKTKPNGIVHVGHIGTADNPTSPTTLAVKETWQNFAAANPNDFIAGFNPANAWRVPPRPPKSGEMGFKIYGLVTADQKLYSIFTYIGSRQADNYTRHSIVGVKEIPRSGLRKLFR